MKKTKKKLKPIEPRKSWSAELQRELERAVFDVIFRPLLEIDEELKENAKGASSLVKALKRGDVTYDGKGFKAVKWSAALSRELKAMGASWDGKRSTWNIITPMMTSEVAKAVNESNKKTETLLRRYEDAIAKMKERMREQLNIMGLKSKSLALARKTSAAFDQTVSRAAGVKPNLTPEQAIILDETYNLSVTKPIRLKLDDQFEDNIEESVFYYTQEETEKLRQMIADNVAAGTPRAALAEKIAGRLDVGYNRAKFIARQETSLYTAQLKQAKYKASGINRYEWKTVGDDKVRHDHRELNGNEYSWDDPPVVDRKSGRRAHPGEDFNCRCVASPIIEFGE